MRDRPDPQVSAAGVWCVHAPGAPVAHHVLTLHADGSLAQTNPDPGRNAVTSAGMGLWRERVTGSGATVTARFVEVVADRATHACTGWGVVDLTLNIDGDRLHGRARTAFYDGAQKPRGQPATTMVEGWRLRLPEPDPPPTPDEQPTTPGGVFECEDPLGVWRSSDYRYLIIDTHTPDTDAPETAAGRYRLHKYGLGAAGGPPNAPRRRWAGSGDRCQWAFYPGPTPIDLGVPLGRHRELNDAKAAADRDAHFDAHAVQRHMPTNWPVAAIAPFYPPASNGTTRAALVIVNDRGRTLARVVGMVRVDGDFTAAVYAEIDITGLGGADTTAESE